jgi:hypothetical protein
MNAGPRHKLGISFNPCYLRGEIPFPKGCEYLEASYDFYARYWRELPNFARGELSHSLHLSRAPFCEPKAIQERFVSYLFTALPPVVTSVGMHLTGRYSQDMGFFGLGTAFLSSPKSRRTVERLFTLIRTRSEIPLLIENANFYDPSLCECLGTLEFQNEICASHGVGIILDLAHLLMNAHNLGVSEDYLLGKVDLRHVAVLHVSGVKQSRDGALHDGHNFPVHPRVWRFLAKVLALLDRPVFVVLEHTDQCWSKALSRFTADLRRLKRQLAKPFSAMPAHRVDPGSAGIGYMANVVLPHRFPELFTQLGEDRFNAAARVWATRFLKRAKEQRNRYSSFRASERFLRQLDHIDPMEDFAVFARQLS